MRKWLVLDATYLCHRAFHSMGQLSYKEVFTGVVYGVLRDVVLFQEYHNTEDILFCFDHGKGVREQEFAGYKMRRRHQAIDAMQAKLTKEFKLQVNKLKLEYLPRIGYRNVFYQEGYEADDLIARLLIYDLPEKDEKVIIGADKDFYQLLEYGVLWNPRTRKNYTAQDFTKEWGLEPGEWKHVKAMAGCTTDDVPGIQGVGEKTAARYMRGELKETSAAHQKIYKGKPIWKRNLPLIELPYKGTQRCSIQPDEVSIANWRGLAKELGMRSLLNQPPPIAAKTLRRK